MFGSIWSQLGPICLPTWPNLPPNLGLPTLGPILVQLGPNFGCYGPACCCCYAGGDGHNRHATVVLCTASGKETWERNLPLGCKVLKTVDWNEVAKSKQKQELCTYVHISLFFSLALLPKQSEAKPFPSLATPNNGLTLFPSLPLLLYLYIYMCVNIYI